MFFRICFVFFIFNTLSSAQAATSSRGSFFEPYLGLTAATFTENITNINGTVNNTTITNSSMTASGDFTGVTGGLRVYEKFFNQFMLGADAGLGISSGKLTLGYLYTMGEYNIVTFTPGLIVGWDIPTILLPRIWAGFYPINTMSLSSDGSSDSDSYGGHSYKFGVSFDWWIQLCFEYSKHTYTSIGGKKLPYTTTLNGLTMTQQKVDYEELLFTISYPFSI